MRSLFVHRIKPSGKDMVQIALDHDEIIIGWTHVPQLLDASLGREDFKRILANEYYSEEPTMHRAGSAAGNMWRFLREMEIGDIVLVPHRKCFYIAEVVGTPTHDPTVEEGGFRRKVRWLNDKKSISRAEGPELYSVLLERKTCYSVDRNLRPRIVELALAYVDDVLVDLQEVAERKDIGPTAKIALAQARIGQGKFHSDLLAMWGGACAVTGCTEPRALRASHAKRWADSTDDERRDPNNGLPLVGTLDALFDSGLIAFQDDGEMLVSEQIGQVNREILGVPCALRRPPTTMQIEFLSQHRKKHFA